MGLFQGYFVIAFLTVVLFAIYLLSVAIAKASMEKYPFTQQVKPPASGSAWWIEVITREPRCTYYFGPFTSRQEAQREQAGYIEDLEQEGAKEIRVAVKWCHPTELTRIEEQEELV